MELQSLPQYLEQITHPQQVERQSFMEMVQAVLAT
jgi:hypothetical protein